MSILVGTEDGLTSLDRPTDRLIDQPVTAVSGRWVLTGGQRLVSLDTGVEATVDGPRAWCVLDLGQQLLVGTAEARVFSGSAASAVLTPLDSFDHIETRDQWYTPWGAPPDTRSLAAGRDGAVLVNVHVGGVWRHGDGDRWDEVIDVDADTHQVVAGGDGAIVAAAAIGFGRSFDGGHTFDWTADGLHATYCRATAIAGDISLVTASTGPGSRHGAIYRRPLGSTGPFEKCVTGLPEWFPFNIDTSQLAAADDTVVLGTGDGRLYRSDDAGSSWELIADELPPVRTVTIA